MNVNGVHECGDSPCSSVPCRNGGLCQAIDSEVFRCECSTYYTGEFCESPVNPCVSNPCTANSVCDTISSGMFICKCPLGRNGENCEYMEQEIEASAAEFVGSSFVQFPRLEGVGRKFAIELTFTTRTSNGLLLYNGQLKNGKGDFISLNLVQGHLQFRFNLGSGIANIT